jgi:anaerobic selenocysteine-containing dehydrogenase
LTDGELVDVSNEFGTVTAVCKVSNRIRPGVVWMPFGGLVDAAGNKRSINSVTPEEPTDWGGGSGFYDAFVTIAKCSLQSDCLNKGLTAP